VTSAEDTIVDQEKPDDSAKTRIMDATVGKLGGIASNAEERLKALMKIMPSGKDLNPKDMLAAISDEDNYVELKDRMLAWWHGDEVAIKDDSPKQKITVSKKTLPDPNEWTPERFQVVQKIWGEGYMEPGGPAFARRLLSPAKIDSKKTVLDISAKLGGTAMLIARDAGLYMEAWESHPGLAKKARNYINSMGLGQRIPLEVIDYDKVSLKKNKYDVIYSRERLFSVKDKKSLLGKIGPSIKPSGFFLFTDLMVNDPDANAKEIAAWSAAERHDVFPWTEELYKAVLKNCGYGIWASHDFSKEYLEHIHAGWHKVVREIEVGKFDRKFIDYLMQEGEIWLARARALENGTLQVKRIQATSPQAD